MNQELRHITDNDWVFITILAIAGIGLLTRWGFNRYFQKMRSFKDFSALNINYTGLFLLYNFLFSALLALVVSPKIIESLGSSLSLQEQSALGFVLIFLFLLAKFIISGLSFIAAGYSDYFKGFIKIKSFFRVWSSFAFLLLALFYYFSPVEKIYVDFLILIFLFISLISDYYLFYKEYRKELKFSYYYIFLYLCALEILPFVIFIKYFV